MKSSKSTGLKSFHFLLLRILRFYLKHSRTILAVHFIVLVFLCLQLPKLVPNISLNGILERQNSDPYEKLVVVLKPKVGELNLSHICMIHKWKSDYTLQNIGSGRDFLFADATELRRETIVNSHVSYPRVFDLDCNSIQSSKSARVDFSEIRLSRWARVLLSNAQQDFLIQFDYLRESKSSWQDVTSSFVSGFLNSVEQTFASDFEIFTTGMPVYEHFILKGLVQVGYLSLAFTILLVLLLRFIFGNYKLGIVSLIPFYVGGLAIYGLMAYFGQSVHILISVAYLIMTLATLQDFLFVAFSQKRGQSAWLAQYTDYILP